MQLFSIGLYKLNMDGTKQTVPTAAAAAAAASLTRGAAPIRRLCRSHGSGVTQPRSRASVPVRLSEGGQSLLVLPLLVDVLLPHPSRRLPALLLLLLLAPHLFLARTCRRQAVGYRTAAAARSSLLLLLLRGWSPLSPLLVSRSSVLPSDARCLCRFLGLHRKQALAVLVLRRRGLCSRPRLLPRPRLLA